MTMDNNSDLISNAIPSIINPVLEKISPLSASETIKKAFEKVEATDSGISYDFIEALLQRTDFDSRIYIDECMQRLSIKPETSKHPSPEVVNLTECSISLKSILSRIPDEIFDRKKFLETIKDTASGIKHLLDAVNKVVVTLPAAKQPDVEYRKKEFVKYSKRFSTTLKDFFKYHAEDAVFESAEQLISQNYLILQSVADTNI